MAIGPSVLGSLSDYWSGAMIRIKVAHPVSDHGVSPHCARELMVETEARSVESDGPDVVNSEPDGINSENDESYAIWADLVERIRSQLGPQELDDKVHDTFVVVVQAIRRGELREPERLMGFVRTVVRRQVAAHIDRVIHIRREQTDLESSTRIPDPSENPEETAIFQQRMELIKRVLSELCDRDREILTRFYLREQGQNEICSEMLLTETQFRLLKSRAKARFGELGRKKITNRTISSVFLRTSATVSH
jgi:RNA polymerase sigma-70 factor (ECF subfamily)